ncbi:MAG TPA: FAD-binding and (Fe-S)-binding domain-containing protein [Anaerolineales bacterium]|nr:FAD-binding and (Fe-S)-binding domain-containing protein [Anaerolineales bacterium]
MNPSSASPRSDEVLGELQSFLAREKVQAHFDAYTRALYSTDASNHQVEPLGVAFPRNADEVSAIVTKAHELALPLLPRGSGTSLGGQAVGACVILDLARHMDGLSAIDAEAQSATVQPGLVCARLNAAAARKGLMYGPDPASADRATFGGMLGNNATGAHSIRYGMSSDHLLEAAVVLSDGTRTRFGTVEEGELGRLASKPGLEGAIYRAASEVRSTAGPAIAAAWPRTWRRASGYGVNYLVGYTPRQPPGWYRPQQPYLSATGFNLAPLLCGSEGTLAVITEATVRLVSRPKATVLSVLPFSSIAEACDQTPHILQTHPSSVELIPRSMIERARGVPAYARKLTFVDGDPAALLVVEYEGETVDEARAAATRLSGSARRLETAEAQANLWAVRKVGLGLLMSIPGDTKPATFIEDVAVPVERLGEYVRRVDAILARHGTRGEWYAHASAGCLHLRPLLNLKSAEGRAGLRRIAEAVFEVVTDMRGSFSGEHGDGLSHTEFNARLFGPEVMDVFRRIKDAFDPQHILNPGKVVPLAGSPEAAIDRQLRYEAGREGRSPATVFAFQREHGFLRAVEACNGAGVCRKDGGLMCPSYQATRSEVHSTRGRANALRAVLSGRLPSSAWGGRELYEILDLCLECKGCKAECPTAVDMARLKAEYLYAYQQANGTPIRSLLFGDIARLLRLARPAAPIANLLRGTRWLRGAQHLALGIDRRRKLPRLAPAPAKLPRLTDGQAPDRAVVLFVDTFAEYSHPRTILSARRVLESAGYNVFRAAGQACCGRPMISKGLLDRARAAARRNIDALFPAATRGVTIVGLEPSCLLTLRDEYLEFFPEDPKARAVAGASKLLEEFLSEPGSSGEAPMQKLTFSSQPAAISVHGHCHAKALVGMSPLVQVLRASGAEVNEIDSGCCGMAGSFGYEMEHYDLSMQIGEMRLFPAVRSEAERGGVVVATGTSCRTQIADGTGVEALDLAEYLASRLL